MSLDIVDVSEREFATEVEEESRRRPVLVDYWAPWCGPCKALSPILTRVVERYAGQLRLAKVDTDQNQTLAASHGIRSLPTVRLFRDGAPVAEFMGAQPESAVVEFIERFAKLSASPALARARELLAAGERSEAEQLVARHLEASPHDEQAKVLLAEIALLDGDGEKARSLLDALPDAVRLAEPVPTLLARARLVEAASTDDDGGGDDLEACYQRALGRIARGDVERGLDGLLDIVRRDRGFRDDGARKALLDAFLALGPNDPRVADYRGRLFSLLH